MELLLLVIRPLVQLGAVRETS